MAAATSAGLGLAVIVTLTVIGWVAAPHDAFSEEIVDILQGAVLAWLVGHHVSFSVPDGQIALLPLGLVLLPGLLLYRSGRKLARSCAIPRLRYVYRAALAIAGPYAAIAGTLALLARTETVEPSMPRALVMGFVIAFLAGGLGVLRQLMRDKGVAARDLLRLMPARSRSLAVGVLVSTSTLLLGGLVLLLVALAVSLPEVVEATRDLRPGLVGGALLVVFQVAYLPNAVVFAVCYALGPGFALGAGTAVAPTGVSVGALPMLPMLAAVPDNGAAPVLSLVALVLPFLAGAVGGVLTQRSAPDVVSEAAPLWGFVCGVTTGILCAALAEVAGGPLGGERLSEVGPSPWQVGLVAALEVGVAAAVAAWAANWWYTRGLRPARPRSARPGGERAPASAGRPGPRAVRLPSHVPVGEGLATVTPLRRRERDTPEDDRQDAEGTTGGSAEGEERAESLRRQWARRREERRSRRGVRGPWWRRGAAEEETEELYGITYEAEPGEVDAPRG
ncbi:DUF6350 family protein [Nocardiopsis sp. ATB16-24]|uniref:cell division protein PerM n=1 Tax=Nocardiopsis sp. ATB16-24 TaxID=3019555 RepID=UPI0025568DB5|nr:DUF6350 family protein [Nocardiopsis sp. ATB16-24]